MSLKRYLLFQFLITVVLAGGAYFPLKSGFGDSGKLPFVYIALGLSSLASVLSFVITYNGLSRSVRMFTSYIMGAMMGKLFFGLISITVVAIQFPDFSAVYVVSYFAAYIIFTSFEVYALMRKLRPDLKKAKPDPHEKNYSK